MTRVFVNASVIVAAVHSSSGGSRVALTLLSRAKTEADYETFLSAGGGWSDVDTDTLLKNIYESHGRSC